MATDMEITAAIEQLTASTPGRDLILISHGISRDLHVQLSTLLKGKQHQKCTLFLTTRGGDPDGAYRIARCLRHHYDHVRLVIASLCKSAGTLIAMAADELIIGDLGELGPLDIQVRKASELEERSSGLDIIQALQAVQNHAREAFHNTLVEIRRGGRLSTRLAGEFAANLATGVAAPLYNQIDPNRLGEMQRAMRIAFEYGERLNARCDSLHPDALETLVGGYPSHSFVIDRIEAASLFKHVAPPSAEETSLSELLWHLLGEQSGHGPMFLRNEIKGPENDDASQNSTGAGAAEAVQGPDSPDSPPSVDPGKRIGEDAERETNS
jgi:hypothetical protein